MPAKKLSPTYKLCLFVSGATERSTRAIAATKSVCEKYMKGDYDLEIVDIYQQPHLLQTYQVVAVPTLVKSSPAPIRRLVGDLSATERVLHGLGIPVMASLQTGYGPQA